MTTVTLTPAIAFTLSGAQLREFAAKGDPVAKAEIERRAAKPARTVAQLRSRTGKPVAECLAMKAKAKAKPAPAQVAVFARAKPELKPAVAPKRDSLKAVRADFGARLDRLEEAVIALAEAVKAKL